MPRPEKIRKAINPPTASPFDVVDSAAVGDGFNLEADMIVGFGVGVGVGDGGLLHSG